MSAIFGASLCLQSVSLAYGGTQVIRDLTLSVEPGEMLALLGASGCGKTTVLKLVAGLLSPDAGSILINGAPVNATPAEKRETALVFQKPLLFPYLSVAGNVGFSLKMRRAPDKEIRLRVEEALAMVRLEGYEARRPSELSGGQEQRVALARALVSDPRILLLDEPFSSLDENLRVEIRTLVRGIQRRLGITVLFVTHDRTEAAAIAHRIAFLHEGRIVQCGRLRDFHERPATLEAARFFGWQILRDASSPRLFAFRPESVRLVAMESAMATGTVDSSIDLGTTVRTTVLLPTGETIDVEHPGPELECGQSVGVSIEDPIVF